MIKFLDFTLDTQQQSLFKAEKRIEISSTVYQLLICFLQAPNKTLSRQELTTQVWPDRVVAETSLDKLIQRLRQTLGDTAQHKSVIKTIHGVGFVFLPEIQFREDTSSSKSPSFKKLTIWLLVAAAALIIWIYWPQNTQQSNSNIPLKPQPQIPLQTVALIPKTSGLSDQNKMWMMTGGIHYLKEQFRELPNIEIKNISLNDLGTDDPERHAIELTLAQVVDTAVVVEIKEVKDLFTAVTQIRNSDGVIAQQTINSDSIKSLYDEVALFTQANLSIQTFSLSNDAESIMSKDRYAVENYIRGMSAQTSGYAAEAIKYFELATKEDPNFWLAWYELSLAHRKQGDYEKALSIISVFENVPLTNKNNLMILNAKALNLYYLGDYTTGIEVLNYGIESARNTDNNKELSSFLTNKALFAKAMDDLDLAQSSIKESITISHTLAGNQDGKLGSAYNTLAGIEINLNQLNTAQEHAKKAIDYFNKAGNKRYAATAKSRLSSIYYSLGEWHKGESMVKEVLNMQQEQEDTLGQTTSYMKMIDYDLLKGDFTEAESHLAKLTELMGGISNKYQNDSLLITQIKVNAMIGAYQSAQNLLTELKAGITSEQRLYSYYILSLKISDSLENDGLWQKLANEFVGLQTFKDQPHSYLTKAQIAEKQGDILVAVDAFEQAKLAAFKHQDVMTVANVMNPYILFLLKNKPEAAYPNLLALEKYPMPSYPFLKVKAQVLVERGEYFKAIALLEELKSISGNHWTIDDQLLLENYHKIIVDQNKDG